MLLVPGGAVTNAGGSRPARKGTAPLRARSAGWIANAGQSRAWMGWPALRIRGSADISPAVRGYGRQRSLPRKSKSFLP